MMNILNVLALVPLLLSIPAQAEDLVFEEASLEASCSSSSLTVRVPALESLTQSKTNVLTEDLGSPGVCRAVRDQLLSRHRHLGSIATKLERRETFLGYGPCEAKVCRSDYQFVLVEQIVVEIDEIRFDTESEIKASERLFSKPWNSQYCPPEAPDCDL
jgi:hypothetical protein